MKKQLDNGLTIADLIEAIHDDKAYASIMVKPSGGYEVYLGWWDTDFHSWIRGDELIDLLQEARIRITAFLVGDQSDWVKEEKPL